jgi:hypothetical protein
MSPDPAQPLRSAVVLPGTVEIGGTEAVVVESTRGIALATPTALVAMMPRPSAEAAESEIHRGAGDIVGSFRAVLSLAFAHENHGGPR